MWLTKVVILATAVVAAGLHNEPLLLEELDDVGLMRRQFGDATSFTTELPTGPAAADPSSSSTTTTTTGPPPPPSTITATTTGASSSPPPPPPATSSSPPSTTPPPQTTPRSSTVVPPPAALPAVTSSVAGGGGGGTPPPPPPSQGGTETPGQSTAQRIDDPAEGAFVGGVPTANIDVPVTFLFMLLFSAGAYTHIRIYRANAKRGHKFLLSDLMFDFCMVRNVTCLMRIIWAFEKARVVVLIALIVQFGGAVVIMVVNIFLAQRVIRSIHPNFGWHPFFGVATLVFIFSVPAVVLNNSTALGVSFYHIDDQQRVQTALNVLKAGVSWIMLLAILPVVSVLLACVIPGPKPERFGVGDTHQKIAVLLVGAMLLIASHSVRLSSTLNPEPPDSQDRLLSKEVFYTTGFMLEILVVVFYAVIRIDLLFHIPNGSSQPGDYSRRPKPGQDDYEAALLTKEEIEDEIAALGHPYEIVDSSGLGRDGSGRTIVAFSTRRMNGEKPVVLPPRPQAYSRVQSIRGSVRSVRGSLRSARGGLSRMLSGRMAPAPYLTPQIDISSPLGFADAPLDDGDGFGNGGGVGTRRNNRQQRYGVTQPLFIQSRFSRYTDPDDERSALRPDHNGHFLDSLRPDSQATSGEIPLSLDNRDGPGGSGGGDAGRRMRRSSIQNFTAMEREGGPLV